ncbi:MAG: hypothetical protein WC745_05210 [Patescibacteria group bacterium]|jgi:hypothetical protein
MFETIRKNIIFKFIHQNQRIIFLSGFCVLFFLALSDSVFAETTTGSGQSIWDSIGSSISSGVGFAVALLIGFISLLITSAMGMLSTMLISVLINIASYSNFTGAPAVITGWVIVRDICNMFFILILLIIAFATILRMENYSIKKMLPKLLIMAVLINFSKTIFGLITDSAQVVMMTFVNAFSQGAGFFVNILKTAYILKSVTLSSDTGKAMDNWTIAVSLILAVIASIITVIILGVMIAVLVVRIVMIWIYTIFSPLVFLGFAFPPIQKYSGQIWQDFIKQVIVGPVLAFFIWLALTTQSTPLISSATPDQVCAGVATFFCAPTFQQFIIVIGLLMGGMMVAQQMGGAAASIAGKGLNWAKAVAGAPGKLALGAPGWVAGKIKMGAFSDLLATKRKEDIFDKVTGEKIGERTRYKGRKYTGRIGGALANFAYGLELNPANMYKGFKEGLTAKSEKDRMRGIVASSDALKGGGFMGLVKGLGASRDLTEALAQGFFYADGFKRAAGIIRGTDQRRSERSTELNKIQAEQEDYNKNNFSSEEIEEQRKVAALASKGVEEAKKIPKPSDPEEAKKHDEEVKRLQEIEEEQNKILTDMEGKLVLGNEKKEKMDDFSAKINSLQKDLSFYRPMQTFYADRDRDALVSQTQQKMGNTNNEDLLKELFKNAIANKDREAAAAIMLHAARVGHLNEMIHSWTSNKNVKEDILDENGKKTGERIVVAKGKKLHQSGLGLNELVNQALIGELGMSEQQAYSVQADASMLAKSVGHFNLAETITSENGRLKQLSQASHMGRIRGEARKVDARTYLRNYNRMAHGDEIEAEDGSGREFRINELGFRNFLENPGAYRYLVLRNEFNKNAAMNIARDKNRLLEFVNKLKAAGTETYWDEYEKKEVSYKDVADSVIRYGEIISKTSVGAGKEKLSVDQAIKEMKSSGAKS